MCRHGWWQCLSETNHIMWNFFLNYLTLCDCDGDAYVDENVGDDVYADDYGKMAK